MHRPAPLADQGVPAELGEPSEALADAYLRLGVTPTYTCAPYLLDDPPARGQQIAWAESNAVFANAVIGARTMKYPDYLDILIALIGRAPMPARTPTPGGGEECRSRSTCRSSSWTTRSIRRLATTSA